MTTLIVLRNAQGFAVGWGPADGTFTPVVPAGFTASTEVDPDLTLPPPTIDQQRAALLQQMRELEEQSDIDQKRLTRVSLLAIAIREATSIATGQITAAINGQAAEHGWTEEVRLAALNVQLATLTPEYVHAQLMLRDKGYKRVFQLEEQIEALREQIRGLP